MKHFGSRALQTTVAALAMSLAGLALAQTTEAPAAPVSPSTVDAKPAAKPHHARKPVQHKHAATPQAREEAAARQAAKQGQLGDGQSASQYERNALARCQVFKTDEDRNSCAQRVRNGQVSGSVQGGGILMESTEQMSR